jgi:hypothetical protein
MCPCSVDTLLPLKQLKLERLDVLDCPLEQVPGYAQCIFKSEWLD